MIGSHYDWVNNNQVGADTIVLHEPGDVGRIAHILKGVAKSMTAPHLSTQRGRGNRRV